MHESQVPGRSVLLPKRLVDRVPLIGSGARNDPAIAGLETWGLAERICALPGITTKCTIMADGTTATDHSVDDPYVLRSPRNGPELLCHIDFDGIWILQLGAMDKAEIIHKGWASRRDDPLTIFMPRDSIEMEITWRIVLLAYQYLTSRPTGPGTPRKCSPRLPKYSSAARYWM